MPLSSFARGCILEHLGAQLGLFGRSWTVPFLSGVVVFGGSRCQVGAVWAPRCRLEAVWTVSFRLLWGPKGAAQVLLDQLGGGLGDILAQLCGYGSNFLKKRRKKVSTISKAIGITAKGHSKLFLIHF